MGHVCGVSEGCQAPCARMMSRQAVGNNGETLNKNNTAAIELGADTHPGTGWVKLRSVCCCKLALTAQQRRARVEGDVERGGSPSPRTLCARAAAWCTMQWFGFGCSLGFVFHRLGPKSQRRRKKSCFSLLRVWSIACVDRVLVSADALETETRSV